MAEILSIENFGELNILERSTLAADVVAGASSFTVENGDNFDTSHKALIGLPGENAEILGPSGVSGNTITATVVLEHFKGELVHKLRGHKARIYRAANVDGSRPAVASFSLLATVTLQADQPETDYIDENGGSDYWYLYTIYNDVPGTPEETDKDVTMAVRGGNSNHFASIEGIKKEAGFTANNFIPASEYAEARDEAEGIIKGVLQKRYTLPLPSVPKVLQRITKLLAASIVLGSSYGIGEEGTNKESKDKHDRGLKLLDWVENGKIALVGDADVAVGTETEAPSGYPDDSAPDDEGFMFRRNQVW